MIKLPRITHLSSLTAVALILIIAAIGIWIWRDHNQTTSVAGSGSSIRPAPPDQGAKRSSSTPSSTLNQGGAADNSGQKPSESSSSSQWASSANGLVTLKEPVKNAVFKPGDAIFGSAETGPVHFTLIDNQVGVVAQGTVTVVGGNFSATANFKSYGSAGRLDVFNTDTNGREINEVQVPVNF